MESLPISQTKSFWKIICVCKIDFAWVAMFSTVAKLKINYCNCIKFHSPRCLGQETAKGPFSLQEFKSSCHLSTCLPHTAEASHCPLNCWTPSREAVSTNFSSLWFDPTGNQTWAYRFGSRRFIHSTTSLSFSNSRLFEQDLRYAYYVYLL